MPRLEKTFIKTGQLRYAFRDFPIAALHPKAFKAHVAARYAGAQGQYWAMHDHIFGHPEHVEPRHNS